MSQDIQTAPVAAPARQKSVLRHFLRHRLGMFGATVISIYVLVALVGPWLSPYDPNKTNLRNVLAAPSFENWFGTDQFGRDILTRIIFGAQTSLLLGLCVVVLAISIGLSLGAIAGYFRGRIERLVVFGTDVLMTMPTIVIALGIVTVLGGGIFSTIVAVSIAAIPRVIRIARGAVLQVRSLEYIESSRTLGAPASYIILRHVIPNSIPPVIVEASLLMAEAVLIAAGLGFLGLGVPPPTAEWGQMLAEGRGYLRAAPHVSIFPGLAIALLVLGLNLTGDGLRDTLDVRTR